MITEYSLNDFNKDIALVLMERERIYIQYINKVSQIILQIQTLIPYSIRFCCLHNFPQWKFIICNKFPLRKAV